MSHRLVQRRLLAALAAVVVAVPLAGCGSGLAPGADGPDGPSGATDGVGRLAPPSGGDPAAALARWRSFPVTADPRPLVLPGGTVLDPATGFRTDSGKLAYLAGDFELATTLPTAPATSAGYALITARTALGRLTATASQQPAPHPLRVVAVSLGQALFATDRGRRALPAWRFFLDQAADPVQVLAVAPKYLWRPEAAGPAGPGLPASLAADGRSVTYSFFGSPAGPAPCGAEYAATVAESRTAVVVSVGEVTPNPRGSATAQNSSEALACPAIAARRTVTVKLAAPLGNRVLLTAEGLPVLVAGG